MKNINIRKTYYHLKHHYLTLNNVVIGVAFVIGASWAWGSIEMMQRNYDLQKEIDTKHRQEQLITLEADMLTYQQKYYQSTEYQELSARKYLGLANPGEKVLILPPNSQQAREAGQRTIKASTQKVQPPSNFEQWVNFLFGGNRRDLHN